MQKQGGGWTRVLANRNSKVVSRNEDKANSGRDYSILHGVDFIKDRAPGRSFEVRMSKGCRIWRWAMGVSLKLTTEIRLYLARPTWGIASLRQTTDFYPRIHR
jgi:hypothetical protein